MSILNFKKITKIINGKILMNKVDFEFEGGQKYIISGESGCGKTTLLNIIAGYTKADEGIVEFAPGLNIGYLFQDEMLFSNLTVKENMFIKHCLLNKENRDFEMIVQNLLSKFNIIDLSNRKTAMLSGGEKQRVQLAMILMSEPDIVLMDEPTSKLDDKNKKSIVLTLKSSKLLP